GSQKGQNHDAGRPRRRHFHHRRRHARAAPSATAIRTRYACGLGNAMISLLFLDFSRSFLFALATLLPILNPPAAAPIYLTLTNGASHRARARLARKVSINIVIMLAGALIAGNMVLAFFGISLPVIRVGGGLLVVATAWQLINASDPDTQIGRAHV